MEDFGELIVWVLIVLAGAVISSKKKSGGKAKVQKHEPLPNPSPKPSPKPRKDIEDAIAAFAQNFEELEEKLADVLPDPDEPAKNTQLVKEALVHEPLIHEPLAPAGADEHGCIGGSIGQHEAEGESIQEHAAHELRRRKALAADAAHGPMVKPSVQDLRRAIIMSEILDKPKALRRR